MAPTQCAPSPSLPADLPLHGAAKHAQTCCGLSKLSENARPSSAGKAVGLHVDEWPKSPSASNSLSPQHLVAAAAVISPCMQCSLALLEQETYDVWIKIGQKEMEGKGMARCYPRQVQNYWAWSKQEQEQIAVSDPLPAVLPAFPITTAKVVVFLHHKSTREKVCLPS